MDRVKKRHASGSRQSEMPLRVADTTRRSMYATPQSKGVQPSYGKLNMSKPQSGTSERKTSFFGARAGGLDRNSSFGGRNSLFGSLGASGKKDPRPLHDKAHVQQCVRKLCEFLTENRYPGGVSTKTLQSPSTKEFLKMFEFIYQQVDPTFEMPKSKVEEEVPRLLRDLGYAFPPSKSSMYSVGAPHTWPQVLGALIWLIDTVKEMVLEEQKWTAEKESVENHQKLHENKLHKGRDDSVQKLKTTQQQHHLVLLETNEERRTVSNNLATISTHAADHLAMLEKSMGQKKRLQDVMSMKENHEMFQQVKDMIDSFNEKANVV